VRFLILTFIIISLLAFSVSANFGDSGSISCTDNSDCLAFDDCGNTDGPNEGDYSQGYCDIPGGESIGVCRTSPTYHPCGYTGVCNGVCHQPTTWCNGGNQGNAVVENISCIEQEELPHYPGASAGCQDPFYLKIVENCVAENICIQDGVINDPFGLTTRDQSTTMTCVKPESGEDAYCIPRELGPEDCPGECNNATGRCYPQENCGNDIDDDRDGFKDCRDIHCYWGDVPASQNPQDCAHSITQGIGQPEYNPLNVVYYCADRSQTGLLQAQGHCCQEDFYWNGAICVQRSECNTVCPTSYVLKGPPYVPNLPGYASWPIALEAYFQRVPLCVSASQACCPVNYFGSSQMVYLPVSTY